MTKIKNVLFSDWFIVACFALWILYGIPLILGIILVLIKRAKAKKDAIASADKETEYLRMKTIYDEIGAEEYLQTKSKIEEMYARAQKDLDTTNSEIASNNSILDSLRSEIASLQEKNERLEKQVHTNANKLVRTKDIYHSISYCIENFLADGSKIDSLLSAQMLDELESYAPSVTLKLHCMDIKSLRKAFKENDKAITKVLESYSSRYTTKANQAIYKLMVIALRAELQNILYELKYEKLDNAIDSVKNMTTKYLHIAGEGNQNIAGTLTKFIGEIEYLFINAVKIEYNYYVKKEQARQEQLALREKMKEEAAERKALEQERKKIENEELKFQTEIEKVQNSISNTTDQNEIDLLQKRILELQAQLSDVLVKKEDIVNLQNGKAGTVYVISNLGSFGDDVFKIGMTRRLDPQDRINELGNASVPFKFDVHSFIFSEDAVALENKMHEALNGNRVNKVNLRKEFFRISIDDLEQLVTEIDPTAEFNKTMLAEDFRQSLSTDEIYTSDYTDPDDEDDE